MPNYTYTESEDEVSQIEAEVQAAQRAGLPAAYTEESDLPYPIRAAVRFDDQARFHPRKWCLGLARVIEGGGSHVFEETRALSVSEGRLCRVRTDRGEIEADRVVVATLLPFTDRGFFFARTHPEREHVLGVRLSGPVPHGMYHPHGMHRELERRRQDLGLPLPRLALRRGGRGGPRAGGRGAGARRAPGLSA